jgi:hypothetical protein
MAVPPSVIFGPSARTNRWWAVLPSTVVVHAPDVGELIQTVERAMTRAEPGRPFAFVLDLHGAGEPGRPRVSTPLLGSAAYRLALGRLAPPPQRKPPVVTDSADNKRHNPLAG